MKPALEVLSQEQIQDIHNASCKVLEETGVWLQETEARALLAKAGCRTEGDIVHIPQEVVEWALGQLPESTPISNRQGDTVMDLGGRRAYYGPGPTCPQFLDPWTEEQRPFTLEDMRNGAILVDALTNLDYNMSYAQISDVPASVADRYEFYYMLKYSSKPICFLARSKQGVQDIIDMAAAVRGGYDALAANPFIICYPEPLSPLKHASDAVEKLLLAAEYGIPIVYTPCPMAGATAPATIAGMLVQSHAEVLSGLVIAQLRHPGVGFITGGVTTIMDMRSTQISYGAPEMDLALAGFADIARCYGIPLFGTAGCTDAKAVDEQAAIECAMSILMSDLSGANLIHDVGFVESGLSFSFNAMVMGDEIISMVRRIGRGIDINADKLAAEVIQKVGPGGNFLADDHTLEHFRGEHWRPSLMDRRNYEAWEKSGRKTMGDRIKDRMEEILETHEVEPLSPEVSAKIEEIMDRVRH